MLNRGMLNGLLSMSLLSDANFMEIMRTKVTELVNNQEINPLEASSLLVVTSLIERDFNETTSKLPNKVNTVIDDIQSASFKRYSIPVEVNREFQETLAEVVASSLRGVIEYELTKLTSLKAYLDSVTDSELGVLILPPEDLSGVSLNAPVVTVDGPTTDIELDFPEGVNFNLVELLLYDSETSSFVPIRQFQLNDLVDNIAVFDQVIEGAVYAYRLVHTTIGGTSSTQISSVS